jgi:hypothetical protein
MSLKLGAVMQDVFELESTTIISQDSYITSYPHLLSYFAPISSFGIQDIVRGAHMVYGWMPTVLELHSNFPHDDIAVVTGLLNKAKSTGNLTDSEIELIAALVNNSIVGASKLLHFVAPHSFAIWDSKIYSYVFNERPHNYRVNQISKYRFYLNLLSTLQKDFRFPCFHTSVNAKFRYNVSPLRALEVVMFLRAPVLKGH